MTTDTKQNLRRLERRPDALERMRELERLCKELAEALREIAAAFDYPTDEDHRPDGYVEIQTSRAAIEDARAALKRFEEAGL